MQYPYQCESCGSTFIIVGRMMEDRDENPPCEHCSSRETYRLFHHQTTLVKGSKKGEELIKPGMFGRNQAEGIRTPAQQQQVLKKVVQGKRDRAKETARHRSASGRKDGELRHVGAIPAELFRAQQRSSGNTHVWRDEGVDLMKRHGVYWGDE